MALGGSFQRAFAFSGGRHVVSPATRPASTFAHETGHIFYARDEYVNSGAHYTDRRGYYNAQNWNAYDNPTVGWVQEPSIMDTGAELDAAWDTHTSAASSLAMIGWQDSDGDGVFDVLDVPLTLTGAGYYNPHLNTYRFTGHSAVQALVNVNSSGLRNDITLNKVNRLVYSLDGGNSWVVAKTYNAPEVNIKVVLPFSPGQQFLLRTEAVDPITGRVVATSAALEGSVDLAATGSAGIQGFVWDDRDADGQWDSDERGVEGWMLQLVDDQGAPIQTAQYLEPDAYAHQTLLSNILPGVTLSAVGWGVFDANVAAVNAPVSAGGGRVFGFVGGLSGIWETGWTGDSFVLRVDFASPTSAVSIDAIAPADGSYGRLEIYDAGGNLLGRTTTTAMAAGTVSRMSIGVPAADIAYALVRSTGDAAVVLDNLQIGPSATAVAGEFGAYAFHYLPPGDYHVMAEPTQPWAVTGSGIQDVTIDVQGQLLWPTGTGRPSDFAALPGAGASPWANLAMLEDVNDDWIVSAVDALLVINNLNNFGSRSLVLGVDPVQAPYIDVSGDGVVSPRDALIVIAALNTQAPAPTVATAPTLTAWSAAVVLSSGGGEGEGGPEGESVTVGNSGSGRDLQAGWLEAGGGGVDQPVVALRPLFPPVTPRPTHRSAAARSAAESRSVLDITGTCGVPSDLFFQQLGSSPRNAAAAQATTVDPPALPRASVPAPATPARALMAHRWVEIDRVISLLARRQHGGQADQEATGGDVAMDEPCPPAHAANL